VGRAFGPAASAAGPGTPHVHPLASASPQTGVRRPLAPATRRHGLADTATRRAASGVRRRPSSPRGGRRHSFVPAGRQVWPTIARW